MKMKRLLCIVGSMNAGGAETFLMKIYRQLDKTKFQMDFAVAIQEEGFYDKEILEMGGKIYHITPKSQGFMKNFNSIKSIVKDNKYGYVLRTSQHSLSALELLAAKMGGAKVRVYRSSNSNTVSGSRKQMLLHKLCKFMPRTFANVRIAPSTEAAEFMFGKGCIQIGSASLLHNAVDTAIYKYDERVRNAVRKELGLEDAFVVGHVGRFNQQKNHMFLLDVFNSILKDKPNSMLVLVGVGELVEDVELKIEEFGIINNVLFLGLRNDVPRILNAFDVFVFPSLYEGMPNTVIEAQATGLPCLISQNITNEANITGLVRHLTLNNPSVWAENALEISTYTRISTEDIFLEKKYNIAGVVNEFTNIVFGG